MIEKAKKCAELLRLFYEYDNKYPNRYKSLENDLIIKTKSAVENPQLLYKDNWITYIAGDSNSLNDNKGINDIELSTVSYREYAYISQRNNHRYSLTMSFQDANEKWHSYPLLSAEDYEEQIFQLSTVIPEEELFTLVVEYFTYKDSILLREEPTYICVDTKFFLHNTSAVDDVISKLQGLLDGTIRTY